jgi:hypothetical protein
MRSRGVVHLIEHQVDLGAEGRILPVQLRQDAGRVVSLAGDKNTTVSER